MNQTCEERLKRLKTIVSLHEEKHEVLSQIRNMREWVMEVEHIFDGSWASQAEEISNAEVWWRLDAWLISSRCVRGSRCANRRRATSFRSLAEA